MRYKLLGKTGLRVSELCLGTMTFGEEWGWGASKEESRKIFDAFAAAGGNFIDTANHYTNGTSEKYLSEFIESDREKFVIATKYTLGNPNGDPNAAGNHKKNLVQSLENSLKRLKVDYIDLYWVHAWDEFTPIEEVMRSLDDVVRAGKVLYVGISNAPAWVVARGNTLTEQLGWTSFSAIQIQYSLIERSAERELLPMAKTLDLAVTAWAPLGGGVLTGKYSKENLQKEESARYKNNPMPPALFNDRTMKIATEIQICAQEAGKTPSQIALSWLLGRGENIIPIIGTRRLSQIKDNLGCLELDLSEEHRKRLDSISNIALGFPHDFLATPFVRDIVYAGMYGSVVNHRR